MNNILKRYNIKAQFQKIIENNPFMYEKEYNLVDLFLT